MPIGVSVRWERDTASYSQVRKFAEALVLPFVRWPLAIVKEGSQVKSRIFFKYTEQDAKQKPPSQFAEGAGS